MGRSVRSADSLAPDPPLIFTPAGLPGAYVVAPEPKADGRGAFARTWCAREFAAAGLATAVAQSSLSTNIRRGTLRGMHYQAAPHEETKLVRCVRGAIFDVIIDLRPDSPTFRRHITVELSHRNALALYVPQGCAHGFQTLEDDTEVWYQMSEFHHPESARGVRWNDPGFGIAWPIAEPILLPRDAAYPDFVPGSR
jgi:dTDP-4-dehydrorhamnose 3,5-epimerase